MTHMEFDSLLEEMQGAGDLFIGVPLCEQAEHIHFTGGQGFGTLWHADGIQEIHGGLGREVHLPGSSRFDGSVEFRRLDILK